MPGFKPAVMPAVIPDAAMFAAAIPGRAAFEQKELYKELRLEAVEAIVEAEEQQSGVILGLASGEGVGIEAGGEMSPPDGALVITVVGEVVEAEVEEAEKAAAAQGQLYPLKIGVWWDGKVVELLLVFGKLGEDVGESFCSDEIW